METAVSHSLLMSEELIEKDRHYVWHPYTQYATDGYPLLIAKAEGAYLYDYNGQRYFDGISSWWVNVHGHSHPHIVESMINQAQHLAHIAFANFTHRPAITLAERLSHKLMNGKGKVFFSDNGSTAVETALKISLQYWYNQSIPRKRVICFKNAYHGDTFGAMSLAGKGTFNTPYSNFLFPIETISPPFVGEENESLKQLAVLLEAGDVACFLFEPLIQAVSGMTLHSEKGLKLLLKLCHDYNVLTIADEVMTGFGRTGPLFACDRLSIEPTITCLSKGLTGGFLPLGATVCHERLFNAFLSSKREKAFLHGHSYCGNPLACAAALASLDLFEREDAEPNRKAIEESHRQFQKKLTSHPSLNRSAVLGTLLIWEYKSSENSYFYSKRQELIQLFLKNGILIRPLGNVLYLMPPYCSTKEDLDHAYECIFQSLEILS